MSDQSFASRLVKTLRSRGIDTVPDVGAHVGQLAAIQLELSFVELYSGQRLYGDLMADLERAGHRVQQIDPGFSGPSGRLLQVDGLFVRLADD